MHYRHLLKDLKSDRPVYGLQPLPLDGKHRIPRTIEAMAADYVAEIQRVQPHGPYFLAGYSFGGRVSFEIAQQLVRQGERVSFLGLIDTIFHEMPIEKRPLISEGVLFSRKIRRAHSLQDLFSCGQEFITWGITTIAWGVWFRLLDQWLQQGHSIPNEHRHSYYEWLCKHANRGYLAKPYPGHITMFSCVGNSERQRIHWGRIALGGLTVLEVPAGHNDMASPPHSKVLAEHFDTCLDAVARAKT
jgi:aspartate racemase